MDIPRNMFSELSLNAEAFALAFKDNSKNMFHEIVQNLFLNIVDNLRPSFADDLPYT